MANLLNMKEAPTDPRGLRRLLKVYRNVLSEMDRLHSLSGFEQMAGILKAKLNWVVNEMRTAVKESALGAMIFDELGRLAVPESNAAKLLEGTPGESAAELREQLAKERSRTISALRENTGVVLGELGSLKYYLDYANVEASYSTRTTAVDFKEAAALMFFEEGTIQQFPVMIFMALSANTYHFHSGKRIAMADKALRPDKLETFKVLMKDNIEGSCELTADEVLNMALNV